MKLLKRIFVSLLILLTFNLYFSNPAFAEQDLTKHPLEIRSTPEEDIPTIKKKTSGWTWVIVVGLLGGLLAVASGGDGDDSTGSGSSDDTGASGDDSGDSGDYTVTW